MERLKWYLWHGNVFLALQTIDNLQFDVDNEDASPEQHKLSKAVSEFGGYIRANSGDTSSRGAESVLPFTESQRRRRAGSCSAT